MILKATRDIRCDEEITIAYIDSEMMRADRQAIIKSSLGFNCKCDHCLTRHGNDLLLELAPTWISLSAAINDVTEMSEEETRLFFRQSLGVLLSFKRMNITDNRVAELFVCCGLVAGHQGDGFRVAAFLARAYILSSMIYADKHNLLETLLSCVKDPSKISTWRGGTTHVSKHGDYHAGSISHPEWWLSPSLFYESAVAPPIRGGFVYLTLPISMAQHVNVFAASKWGVFFHKFVETGVASVKKSVEEAQEAAQAAAREIANNEAEERLRRSERAQRELIDAEAAMTDAANSGGLATELSSRSKKSKSRLKSTSQMKAKS